MHDLRGKLHGNLNSYALHDLKNVVKFDTWYEVWTLINVYLENSLDSCLIKGLKHKLKQVSNDASHK